MYSNGYVQEYLRYRELVLKYEKELRSRGLAHVVDRIRQESEDV